MSYSDLLDEINAVLPKGIDWKQGAIEYLASVIAAGDHSDGMAKPYRRLNSGSPVSAYCEISELLQNFVNVFTILRSPAGSVILDVACGTGWLAHYWERLGYKAYGFDICEDFIKIARQRVADDPLVRSDPSQMYFVHDIEEAPLTAIESVRAAIFESCFHHFHDPIRALRNVGESLSEDGVAVIIEGESRVRPEDRDVMLRYHTIERPYSRDQLKGIMAAANLPYYAFFAPINNWVAQGFSTEHELPYRIVEGFEHQNRCICARSADAIRRIVPDWAPPTPFEFGFGFSSGGAPGVWWCGPYGQVRVCGDCRNAKLLIGPTAERQPLTIYHDRGVLARFVLDAPKVIDLSEVVPGQTLHLCSEQAFSPAWTGVNDIRLLSFWAKTQISL